MNRSKLNWINVAGYDSRQRVSTYSNSKQFTIAPPNTSTANDSTAKRSISFQIFRSILTLCLSPMNAWSMHSSSGEHNREYVWRQLQGNKQHQKENNRDLSFSMPVKFDISIWNSNYHFFCSDRTGTELGLVVIVFFSLSPSLAPFLFDRRPNFRQKE